VEKIWKNVISKLKMKLDKMLLIKKKNSILFCKLKSKVSIIEIYNPDLKLSKDSKKSTNLSNTEKA